MCSCSKMFVHSHDFVSLYSERTVPVLQAHSKAKTHPRFIMTLHRQRPTYLVRSPSKGVPVLQTETREVFGNIPMKRGRWFRKTADVPLGESNVEFPRPRASGQSQRPLATRTLCEQSSTYYTYPSILFPLLVPFRLGRAGRKNLHVWSEKNFPPPLSSLLSP